MNEHKDQPVTLMRELSRKELQQTHGGAQFSVQLYFGTPSLGTAEDSESAPYQGTRSSGGYVPT